MAAGFGAGQIAKLVAALIEGDDNMLDRILSNKLEHLGEEFLMKYIGGPMAVGQRVAQAVDSGGLSELKRLGDDWAKAGLPAHASAGFMGKMQKMFTQIGGRSAPRAGQWGRTDWARSRDDWLNNHWRHDWRSQPRDAQGRWVPGRLEYIAAQLQYRGTHKGRALRRKAKLRTRARRGGRAAARRIFREINQRAR